MTNHKIWQESELIFHRFSDILLDEVITNIAHQTILIKR